MKEQTKFRNHEAREEGSTRRGLESREYEPVMRTTETAYPESKLPLQPTGQNRSSSSLSRRREHVCLVSPLLRSLALSLALPFSLSLLPRSPGTHLSVCHSTDLSRLPTPALCRPPWYSGLINCVYTAVNSYRCLAPANWSSSRGPPAPHAGDGHDEDEEDDDDDDDTRHGYPSV